MIQQNFTFFFNLFQKLLNFKLFLRRFLFTANSISCFRFTFATVVFGSLKGELNG